MKVCALLAASMILLASAGWCAGSTEEFDRLLAEGIKDDAALQPEAALKAFEQADALQPEQPEVLLRLAKSHSDLLVKGGKTPAARAHGEKARELSERAIELAPDNAKAHLSLAVSYGRLTDFVGAKERLRYSKLIRAQVDRSLALDPNDDFAYHVLGRWYAGIANLNPMLKTFARVVYGELPEASNAEAAAAMQKAIRINPNRIVHHAQLARIYERMNKIALARKEWEKVIALPIKDPEDASEKEAATAALARLAS